MAHIPSFGSQSTINGLQQALNSVELTNVSIGDGRYEDEVYEEAMATGPVFSAQFQEPRVSNQESAESLTDEQFNAERERLEHEYPTAHSKTQRVNAINREQDEMNDVFKQGGTPIDIIDNMIKNIDRMAPSEQKNNSIKLLNTFVQIFEECRNDKLVREFAHKLFKQTDLYYGYKQKRKALELEEKILNQMRRDAHVKNAMAMFDKKIEEEKRAQKEPLKVKRRKVESCMYFADLNLLCLF